MDTTTAAELLRRLAAVDIDTAARDALVGAVADVGRLRSWCDAAQHLLTVALEQRSPNPEGDVANATRGGFRDGMRNGQRSKTMATVPELVDSLGEGDTTADHVDAVTAALGQLEPGERDLFISDASRAKLVEMATRLPADRFRTWLRGEVRRLRAHRGEDLFLHQQRETCLQAFLDPATGMGVIHGRFDPLSYLQIVNALNATIARLFNDKTPDTCPTDPFRKQDHLRALALLDLINTPANAPRRNGRPEAIVVIDTRDIDPATGRSTIDWGLPVDVPPSVFDRLAPDARTYPVIVHHDVLLWAPGRLNLGREARLANADQRRVLRGLYPSCACGCGTRFDLCHIHHIDWWEHLGLTDIDRLIPLCNRTHHKTHDDGWKLHLARDGTLTITHPDTTAVRIPRPRRSTNPANDRANERAA